MSSDFDLEPIHCIAWDFDGVLNRNVIDGRFLWHAALEREFGVDIDAFVKVMFRTDPQDLASGKEDVLDRLERWKRVTGFEGDVEDVLELWLNADLHPCEELKRVAEQLRRAGITQVLATNNEPRRARHIWNQAGFGDLLDEMFASGHLGVMKPDPAFFARIEEIMQLPSGAFLLIDDLEDNVVAAKDRGWQAFHYREDGALELAQRLMPLMLLAE